MKASFRHIFAALAATAALVACTKETTPPSFENDKVNPAAEGSRVIAVSFAPQTKTALSEDGLQPVFVHGDKILVANGQDEPDTCKVSVKDGKATISTKLTGPLTAVYPAKAAGMNSGNPKQIDTVLVSTVQSGEFADANICMAKMKGGNDESLSFENKTAVFCIYPQTDNPEYVEVSAKNFDIANDYPTGSDYQSLDTIHVATTTADSVWVSILVPDDLTIGNLAFSDGTNVKTVTGDRASEPVAASTIYKVTVPKSFTVTCETVTITGASFSVMKENAAVAKASPGDVLKVEVTCPNGYIVGGITVFKTGDSSTTVEVGTDGSFTMPEYEITVSVEFELDESGGGTEMEHGGLLG